MDVVERLEAHVSYLLLAARALDKAIAARSSA
jgi:hypothetical protein